MNCSKCEAPGLPGQKFCRSCGASLQVTTRPFAESPSLARPQIQPYTTAKVSKQGSRNLMLAGFIVLFAGFATVIVGGTLIQDVSVLGVGMLLVLAGMALVGGANLWRQTRPKPVFTPLPEPQPTTYLPQERSIAYTPSITEQTTDLLPTPVVNRDGQ